MYRSDDSPVSAPTGPAPTLFEAIATRHCLEATYNGGLVVLAPHVAFVRHGSLYAGAVTLLRDGQPPREEKIGIFKLDGLVGLKIAERSFAPSIFYDATDERFGDAVMLAVDRAA